MPIDALTRQPFSEPDPKPIKMKNMTLLDWFAGQALATQTGIGTSECKAEKAYDLAFFMMEKRENDDA